MSRSDATGPQTARKLTHKHDSFNPGLLGYVTQWRQTPFCSTATVSTQAQLGLSHSENIHHFFDKSLPMVEKLKASSLSTLYDLNHSPSSGEEDNRAFKSTAPLERDGHGFISTHQILSRVLPPLHREEVSGNSTVQPQLSKLYSRRKLWGQSTTRSTWPRRAHACAYDSRMQLRMIVLDVVLVISTALELARWPLAQVENVSESFCRSRIK